MGTLARAVGIGIVDETALKQRLDDIAQRMMDYAISKWCR